MSSILALALMLQGGAAAQAKPVELSRKFTLGEKLSYFARAQFTQEQRSGSLQTLIPNDEEISYRYTMTVQKVKADGIAEILYLRPNMTIVEGDTAEAAAKSMTEKLDWKMQLDVSPINEVVAQKDLNPKKPGKEKDAYHSPQVQKVLRQGSQSDRVAIAMLFSYVGEIQRLAFFVGSLDSGLDIAPKFPFDEVTVGTTWKSTVGYSPQKLKGSDGKSAVQRLDYTYTYQGLMKNKEGKEIHRVQAKVKLDTDLVDYARQVAGGSASSSMLKSVPLGFEGTVDFDLDPATFHTIKASAESKGHFSIEPKGGDQALLENYFKGRTTVKLEGRNIAPAAGTAPKTPPKKGKGGN